MVVSDSVTSLSMSWSPVEAQRLCSGTLRESTDIGEVWPLFPRGQEGKTKYMEPLSARGWAK